MKRKNEDCTALKWMSLVQKWDLVNTGMKFRVPQRAGNFVT
jgi:hypothetical protein